MPVLLFPIWLLLVLSAGWLFFPVSRRIFGHAFPDGGLAVGRILFLGFWTLAAFWLGRAGIPTQYSAWLYALFAVAGLYLWQRDKKELGTQLKQRKRAIYSSEGIFLGVLLLFFLLRGFWSDANGNNGEKGMDSALIATLARADRLPPPNPYSAGARLQSYYTFGHLETALLQNVAGTTVRWSYNLMCATLPALCISAMFSLGAALTGRLWGGGFVAFVVLFLGTLQPIFQWSTTAPWLAERFMRLDHMATSRVIPYSINEYPFFTFNQGDLHAHYFSITFQIAVMAIALSLFLRFSIKRALVAAAVLGSLILTNTWDFPAYFLLIALSIFTTKHFVANRSVGFLKKAGTVFLVLSLAIILALPFLLGLTSSAGGPKPLSQPASPLRNWLLLWGMFTLGWWCFASYSIFRTEKIWRYALTGLGIAVLFAAYRSDWGYPTGLTRAPYDPEAIETWQALNNPARLVLPLIIANIGIALAGFFPSSSNENEDQQSPQDTSSSIPQFLCALALCGLISLLVAETTWAGFLGSADTPGFADSKRQDTVFKFGMQTWMLWGTASAAGAFLTLKKWPYLLRLWAIPLVAIMAISSISVVMGRTRNFNNMSLELAQTLMGRSPDSNYGQYEWWDTWNHLKPSEKETANWLESHIKNGENILEAEQKEGGDYTIYTRYTHATGIPTVIGPQAHSFQWSPANARDAGKEWDEVFKRKANARSIYENRENRAELLRLYGVKYIVWGELERVQYSEQSYQSLVLDSNLTSVARFGDDTDPRRVEIFRFDSLRN
jgi:uncharacterized membrane protein